MSDRPKMHTETKGRSIRAIVTGPRGTAASSWWGVDDGSAEQEAGERYDRLPSKPEVPHAD